MNKWSEKRLQRVISRELFKGALMLVPNCNWTGYECDLLVVEKNLRIIDIEVKISKADFKADCKKDKWWSTFDWQGASPHDSERLSEYRKWDSLGRPKIKREFPTKVWKHYFAIPAEIYEPELHRYLPSQNCGIITFREDSSGSMQIRVRRPAKPNKEADRLSPENAIDIARLAALRMWNTYNELENANHTIDRLTKETAKCESL